MKTPARLAALIAKADPDRRLLLEPLSGVVLGQPEVSLADDEKWSADGCDLRLRGLIIEMRDGDAWNSASLRELAVRWPGGSGPWAWLFRHGIRRPAPTRNVARRARRLSRRGAQRHST